MGGAEDAGDRSCLAGRSLGLINWFNAVIEVGYWLKGVLAVAGSADRCCVASGASLFDGLSFRQ